MFFIVTPSFNYGRYIEAAILSVIRQDCPPGEKQLHVQDACSTDETVSILASYEEELSYRVEPDEGQCDALNRGFTCCPDTVDFVGWLNADEFYLPGAFDIVRRYFEANPDVDVVFGDSIHSDESGALVRLVAQHRFSSNVLKHYGPYPQSGATFYRRKLLDVGLLRLDLSYRQIMDQELYLRLVSAGVRFGHLPVPLCVFRLHDSQLTNLHGREVARVERERLGATYGFRERSKIGHIHHAVLKWFDGAYARESIAASWGGLDLLWIKGDEVAALVVKFLDYLCTPISGIRKLVLATKFRSPRGGKRDAI